MLLIFTTIFIATIFYFVLFSSILNFIFKSEKTYTYIIAVVIAFILALQQLPSVKKNTAKLLTYQAIEVKITFDKNLTTEELENNLQAIMYHFSGHEKSYRPIISYPKGKYRRSGYGTIVAESQKLPHYWSWKEQELSIYLSTPLSPEQLAIFQKKLHQRFFDTYDIPKTISVKSTKKSLLLSMLLSHINIEYNQELKVDTEFVAHDIQKLGRDEIGERKALCSISLKIKGDYWNTLFEKTQKSNLPIGVMMGMSRNAKKEQVQKMLYTQLTQMRLTIELNKKEYPAFIFFDTSMQQYLGIILEEYVEENFDNNEFKAHILMNPTFTSAYSDVQKDCLFSQLQHYPLLEQIVVEKNFLQKFQGKPTAISVKRTKFSPLYNQVKEVQ